MTTPHTFAIGSEDFLLDGEPYRILSGAIHYFRVHPDQWRDRIHKARLLGLNTIETYIPWNFHAPTQDEFHLDGPYDLGRFLDEVAAEGLNAIVRPGPYICAEWDNGGLPVWLTRNPNIRLRSSDPIFMGAMDSYFGAIAPVITTRLKQNGGPIILMQVENEYGAYGADKEYLRQLVELYKKYGFDVPLTTVDQPFEEMLVNGRLDGLHMTGSFGSRAEEKIAALRKYQPTGPIMCSEFWDGWFDSWGIPHHTTSAAVAAHELDAILSKGGSVNLYMLIGGTNFGLTNGANHKGQYVPLITSYDYDAPLAEDGTPTEKYWAFRDVIARYAPVPDETPAMRRTPAPALTSSFDTRIPWAALLDQAAKTHSNAAPSTFDDLLRNGYLLYSREISAAGEAVIEFTDLRDRAQAFLNGALIGTLDRDHGDRVLALPHDAAGTLEILVEDLGRVNYDTHIGEWKGLGPVLLDGKPLLGWDVTPVDLDYARITDAAERTGEHIRADHGVGGPVLLQGRLSVETSTDLFLSTEGWGKGVAWINGFCLGRYWSRGPQKTLYVPAPVVNAGTNIVTIFDVNGAVPAIVTVPEPDLGYTEV